jgi:DNA-binding transcriptional MocR family regulator
VNSGATTERVYDAIRRRILDHEFRPDERLDPAQLADAHLSSVTPVREALNLLAGQGLVASRSGGGFHVPPLDEPALKDMYAWCADLLGLALRSADADALRAVAPSVPDLPVPERTAALFAALGRSSPNAEHGRAVEAINARLHAVRRMEEQVLGDGAAELDPMDAALAAGRLDMLRRHVAGYHRRRRWAAAQIVRAVYRA